MTARRRGRHGCASTTWRPGSSPRAWTWRLTPAGTPYSARWTADGGLTALVTTEHDGGAAVVRVLTVDPGTGAVKQRDTYTIGKSRYAFYAAGETA